MGDIRPRRDWQSAAGRVPLGRRKSPILSAYGTQNGKLAMPLAHYSFSKMTYETAAQRVLPNADATGFWHSAMPPTCTSIELVTVYREPSCFTNT